MWRKTENNSMQLNLFESLFTRVYTYNQNGQKIVPRGNELQDFLWAHVEPGSWQSSGVFLLCLSVHFPFLEVDFRHPNLFCSLTRQKHPGWQVHSCVFSVQSIQRTVPLVSQNWCWETRHHSASSSLVWDQLVLIKAFGTFFPWMLHGYFFFLIQFSADLLRDCSWSKKPPHATPTSPTIFIKSMQIWWKLFYFHQNS